MESADSQAPEQGRAAESSEKGIVKLGRFEQAEQMKTNLLSYRGYRFPHEIIRHAVWLYHRF